MTSQLYQKPQNDAPFISMQVFMEQELRRMDRGRAFIYKQGQRIVARELLYGTYSNLKCENVPPQFDIDELEQQLMQTQLKINGEYLMTAYQAENILILDNKENRNVGSAAIITFPEEETLVLIAFNQSDIDFNYVKMMNELQITFRKFQVFKYPQLNLNYMPPDPPIVYDNNFAYNKVIRVLQTNLKRIHTPTPFDINNHRLSMLLFLNPLFPTFEFMLDLINQIQEKCTHIYIAICVKGVTKPILDQLMKKTDHFTNLNIVQEHGNIADILLKKNQCTYCMLVDQFPEQEPEKLKSKRILATELKFFQKLQLIIENTNGVDNQQCTKAPAILYQSDNFSELIHNLECACDIELDKKNFAFNVEQQICKLFGVTVKMWVANSDNVSMKYHCVYFSRNAVCKQIIQKISQHCNLFLCIKGVFAQTFKNAQQNNSNLSLANIIYDDNNIFRICDDMFNSSTKDHVILFDEMFNQVDAEFNIANLPMIMEKHDDDIQDLKLKQQEIERQNQEKRQLDDNDDIMLLDANSNPIKTINIVELDQNKLRVQQSQEEEQEQIIQQETVQQEEVVYEQQNDYQVVAQQSESEQQVLNDEQPATDAYNLLSQGVEQVADAVKTAAE